MKKIVMVVALLALPMLMPTWSHADPPEAAPPEAGSPEAPANEGDMTKPGEFKAGAWQFKLKALDDTQAPGQPGAMRGELYFEGKRLPEPPGEFDRVRTPWGLFYWVAEDLGEIKGWTTLVPGGPYAGRGNAVPTPMAAQRAAALKAGIDTFKLTLRYVGAADKPYYSVTLLVPAVDQKAPADPFAPVVSLSAQDAGKLVDHLAAEGFLDESADVTRALPTDPAGPAYILTVSAGEGDKKVAFRYDLEFKLETLSWIESLRKGVAGPANDELGKLLERMGEHRKKWQAQSEAG